MHPTTLPVDEVDFLVATIEGELQKISEIAVQIPSLALIPHYANAETTVFMKMLAYHHSYMAEITHDDAQLTWQDHPLVLGFPHSGSIQRKWDLTGYHRCRRLQMSFYA